MSSKTHSYDFDFNNNAINLNDITNKINAKDYKIENSFNDNTMLKDRNNEDDDYIKMSIPNDKDSYSSELSESNDKNYHDFDLNELKTMSNLNANNELDLLRSLKLKSDIDYNNNNTKPIRPTTNNIIKNTKLIEFNKHSANSVNYTSSKQLKTENFNLNTIQINNPKLVLNIKANVKNINDKSNNIDDCNKTSKINSIITSNIEEKIFNENSATQNPENIRKKYLIKNIDLELTRKLSISSYKAELKKSTSTLYSNSKEERSKASGDEDIDVLSTNSNNLNLSRLLKKNRNKEIGKNNKNEYNQINRDLIFNRLEEPEELEFIKEIKTKDSEYNDINTSNDFNKIKTQEFINCYLTLLSIVIGVLYHEIQKNHSVSEELNDKYNEYLSSEYYDYYNSYITSFYQMNIVNMVIVNLLVIQTITNLVFSKKYN